MKRITSFLLAILMLVTLVPVDSAHAMGGEKLDVALLNDGQYMIKLPGVDYTMAKQVPVKPEINPTDNPDDFWTMDIKVDIDQMVLDSLEYKAEKIEELTVEITCQKAKYSKKYTLKRKDFGKAFEAPVPNEEYNPMVFVTFPDGRDSRFLVEAKNSVDNTTEIQIAFVGHTGVATRWHGNSEKPDVEANFIGINKTNHKFALPKVDQNTVLRSPKNLSFQWRDHDNLVLLGNVPEADIKVNDLPSAKDIHLEIQNALQGQLAGSKYYFQITGESYTHRGFTATMREKNTVDFDAGDGKWKAPATKPAQQFAANGLKLNEKFMEAPDTIGPVTVPNGESDLTPPEAEAGKPAKKFAGWSTTKNGPAVDMATYVVAGDVTFYALYAEEEQGKVKVEYKDSKTKAAIDSKYQLKGQEYPAEKTGDMNKKIKDEVFDTNKAPKFLGYKIKSITTDPVPNPPATANYTKNGDYTVIYTYDKLDEIIPEKKNGQDNPDVTPEVKEHYAKVTFQVAAADDAKAKLQLDGADATSPLVYYVNPLEGKTIAQVADVKAVSKDTNLYKVDANDMWTFDPDSITSTGQKILQARDDQDNVVKTEITLTAKVADTDAQKYKDQLKAKDIVKWVKDPVEWKDGVEPITGVTFKSVKDLGNRNTENAGVFTGKLKVTFNDYSTAEIDKQKLIVREKKADKVTPGEDDPGTYPADAIFVKFVAGTGITALNPANKEMALQKDEKLVEGDYPAVTVDSKYKTKATKLEYYDVQPSTVLTAKETTITASTTIKGEGSAEVVYKAGTKDLTSELADLKIAGQNYPANNKLTGTEDSAIDTTKITQPELLGYKIVNITTEPTTDAKYTEAGTAKVIFNYEKLDDIVGPNPGVQKPAGYVTVMFKADDQNPARGNFGSDGNKVEYYVNPKTVTIDKTAQKLSGKNKDNQDINKDFPTLTVTDNNFVANKQTNGNYDKDHGTQQWLVNPTNGIVNNKLAQTITENDTLTLTAMYLGKFNVTYEVVVKPAGKVLPKPLDDATKEVTKTIEKKGLEPGTVVDNPKEIDLSNLKAEDKKLVGPEVGQWSVSKWDRQTDNSGNIKFVLTWTLKEDNQPAPVPTPEYNPWWPIWFGSTKTEVKPEPKHLERHEEYIAGYPDGTVRPDGKITRAEVSAIFARLTENSAPANYSPKFSDVRAYDWFCDSVMKLSNKDIIKGYPDGTFKPNKSITRAEFAVIASKYIKNPKAADETFSDVPMNHWAKDAIAKVKAEGWISGYTDGTFKPDAPITRAEAVSIVNRMFDRAADGEFVREHGFEIKKFNDLTDKHWAYYEIMEAVHTHDYERIDKRTERWDKIVK